MASPAIVVLAGVNGAGKTSIGGALLRQAGVPYFNPDDVAQEILAVQPALSLREANSLAWQEEVRQLEEAMHRGNTFAFETTLGGTTITAALQEALDAGLDVLIWFVGLERPELHIARVEARVARGGHPIAADTIRQRFDSSRLNLIRLMGRLKELKVFDNSVHADPHGGQAPEPGLLLHLLEGRVLGPKRKVLRQTPDWAKAIIEAALALEESAQAKG